MSNILFLIGNTLIALVGLLHLYVHFKQLVSSEVEEKMLPIGRIPVATKKAEVWKLWQGMSFLFGVLLVALGSINMLILFSLSMSENPLQIVNLITILVVISIIYSGYKFFGPMQVYGGYICLILFGLSMFLS